MPCMAPCPSPMVATSAYRRLQASTGGTERARTRAPSTAHDGRGPPKEHQKGTTDGPAACWDAVVINVLHRPYRLHFHPILLHCRKSTEKESEHLLAVCSKLLARKLADGPVAPLWRWHSGYYALGPGPFDQLRFSRITYFLDVLPFYRARKLSDLTFVNHQN
jgi:hypothetical protein